MHKVVLPKLEISTAFEVMMKARLKNRASNLMFSLIGYQKNGANTSLLAVGTDGMTTMHVLQSEKHTEYFIDEIDRLVNQFEKDTKMPRLIPKKYKIREIESANGKKRNITIPCLRDQVVIKCILNRLNTIGITDEQNKPNPRIDVLIRKATDLISKEHKKKIIRTDISNFYPSINRKLLLEKLRSSHGEQIGTPIINLIEKFIDNNKSSDDYTGLPVGVGISVLLANYYISQMNLSEQIPQAEIIRYEDDFLIIVDASVDEVAVMNKFDKVLDTFSLKRNLEKTKVFNAIDEFDFLGVSFKNGKPFIPDERFDRWKKTVKEDIKKQFKELKILKLLNQNINIPQNKKIVESIWREHKTGLRSKFYKHRMRINNISLTNQP